MAGTDETQDTVPGHPEKVPDATESRLVEHLRGEVEYLRDQLATTIQQLAAERERADVLQREALGRIEALSASVVDETTEAGAEHVERDSGTPVGFWERVRRWIAGESQA